MRPTFRRLRTTRIRGARLDRRAALLVSLACLAYVSIGLPDGMLGVAWPSISTEFGVPISSLGVLITALTVGYGAATFSSGRVIQAVGPVAMVSVGAVLIMAGLLGYAVAPAWWVLLACAVVVGVGGGALDGALNVYAALNFSARSTNWMHGFYALGAALGPVVMTGFLVSGSRWQWGFVAGTGVPLAVAATVITSRSRWRLPGEQAADAGRERRSERTVATLRMPATWTGIAMFILYTGLEVTAGQWAFTLLTEGRGLGTGAAGTWVSAFFLGLTGGRIGLGLFAGVIPAQKLLRYCIAASVLAAALFWLNPAPWVAFTGLLMLGLSFGPVFPSLVFTTPSRVGRSHAPNAIGFEVSAAALGAALIPVAVGLAAGSAGLEAISVSVLAGTAALLVLYEVTERRTAGKA